MAEVEIFYLGHSGFAFAGKKSLLVLDYIENTSFSLWSDVVIPNSLQERDFLFLASHNHHDHYDRKVHAQFASNKQATWVLGGFSADIPGSITVKPRENIDVYGISIYTGASTDLGVCFLIEFEDITIYHGGDNADWQDGPQNKQYYTEVDYLAGLSKKMDIACMPVCTSSGQCLEDMTKGAVYAARKFQPEILLPMHGNGRVRLYEEFAQEAGKDISAQIYCMKRAGERFFYKRGQKI